MLVDRLRRGGQQLAQAAARQQQRDTQALMEADAARRAALALSEQRTLMFAGVSHDLVSNAVRYIRHGRSLVGVRRRAGGVELQVLDTGPGLLPEQLARLQQPFRQGSSDAAEGHGLGLFVVRTLCQQNGLQLSVSSRIGRGSVFRVWIPVEAG